MERLADLGVSRETISALKEFEGLVIKWTRSINLVSKNTVPEIWERHILDSIPCWPIASKTPGKWVDIGSGGGFPAIVLAILAKEQDPDTRITCIESDHRKCEFLRSSARQLGIKLTVVPNRIEHADPQSADVLTSRALAHLDNLLEFAELHLNKSGKCVFMKGETWKQELDEAQKKWRFTCETHESWTNPAAKILEIRGITRA